MRSSFSLSPSGLNPLTNKLKLERMTPAPRVASWFRRCLRGGYFLICTFVPARNSSVPRTATVSPAASAPNTSTKSLPS